jgi:hypothetical protein
MQACGFFTPPLKASHKPAGCDMHLGCAPEPVQNYATGCVGSSSSSSEGQGPFKAGSTSQQEAIGSGSSTQHPAALLRRSLILMQSSSHDAGGALPNDASSAAAAVYQPSPPSTVIAEWYAAPSARCCQSQPPGPLQHVPTTFQPQQPQQQQQQQQQQHPLFWPEQHQPPEALQQQQQDGSAFTASPAISRAPSRSRDLTHVAGPAPSARGSADRVRVLLCSGGSFRFHGGAVGAPGSMLGGPSGWWPSAGAAGCSSCGTSSARQLAAVSRWVWLSDVDWA